MRVRRFFHSDGRVRHISSALRSQFIVRTPLLFDRVPPVAWLVSGIYLPPPTLVVEIWPRVAVTSTSTHAATSSSLSPSYVASSLGSSVTWATVAFPHSSSVTRPQAGSSCSACRVWATGKAWGLFGYRPRSKKCHTGPTPIRLCRARALLCRGSLLEIYSSKMNS